MNDESDDIVPGDMPLDLPLGMLGEQEDAGKVRPSAHKKRPYQALAAKGGSRK